MNRVRFTFVRDGFNRTAVAALVAALEGLVEDLDAFVRTVGAGDVDDLELDTTPATSEILCFSTMTASAGKAFDIHRRLRRRWGGCFTSIFGGAHASGDPRSLLEAGIDYCCVGEGEDVIRAMYGQAARGEGLQAVPGLFRLENGSLVGERTPAPVDIQSYNALPMRVQFPTYIEIGRGCRWKCLYCQTPQVHGAVERYRSPGDVEKVVRRYAEFGMKDFRFLLPNALGYMSEQPGVPNCAALEELLARSGRACGGGRLFLGSFPSEVRPDYVTERALRVIKAYVSNAGLVIGGQSGSRNMLEAVKRGHGVGATKRACEISLACGFEASVDLVLGFPGETKEDRRATIGLIEQLGEKGVTINMHFFMPLPGTALSARRPMLLSDGMRRRLDRYAQQGILRGRWRRQEQLSRKWACP
jgi:B12-binding domain/radical SAM domain protein